MSPAIPLPVAEGSPSIGTHCAAGTFLYRQSCCWATWLLARQQNEDRVDGTMKTQWHAWIGICALGGLVGCSNATPVEEARQDLHDERIEAQQEIAEAEHDANATRHETMRPISGEGPHIGTTDPDTVEEVTEERREGQDEIAEAREDLQEAKQEQSEDATEEIDDAEETVADQEKELNNAKDALKQAKQQHSEAETALAQAKESGNEDAIEEAQSRVEDAQEAVKDAQATVDSKAKDLEEARTNLASAEQKLEQAESTN